MPFQKGHPPYKGSEKGWIKKGEHKNIKTEFRCGIHVSPNTEIKKGQRLSPKTEFKKRQLVGEKNVMWRGDDVGYHGLHDWVIRYLGKTRVCEFCKETTGRVEWANKSHEYKRQKNDWISLCKKCHYLHDKNNWGEATLLFPEIKK